jgi:fucose permease
VPTLTALLTARTDVSHDTGPMFPILMNHTARTMPRRLLTGAVGWVSAIAVSGSAVLPLLTGMLSAKFGIVALQPLCVFVCPFSREKC